MKLILILPSQDSIFSNLYEVYIDLNNALTSLGIENKIIEVKLGRGTEFPFGMVDNITMSELSKFIESTSDRNTVFVTVDDHSIVNWLYQNEKIENLVLWAHYFYGSKFIFQLYRNYRAIYPPINTNRLLKFFAGFIPNSMAIQLSHFYRKTLLTYPVFSQSIWTGLLLERVLSVPVLGTVHIPVDQELYNFEEPEKREGILVFLGNAEETDLKSLNSVLKTLEPDLLSRLDYFGNEKAGKKFEDTYEIKMNFIGKVERRDLLRCYSGHLITISPIFNGTFEMVPIQSLLCGTPVISFAQPFLEVTGESNMIANIHNLGEIKHKMTLWKNLNPEARRLMKTIILEKMDSKKVAQDLLKHLENLGFR